MKRPRRIEGAVHVNFTASADSLRLWREAAVRAGVTFSRWARRALTAACRVPMATEAPTFPEAAAVWDHFEIARGVVGPVIAGRPFEYYVSVTPFDRFMQKPARAVFIVVQVDPTRRLARIGGRFLIRDTEAADPDAWRDDLLVWLDATERAQP